MIKIRKAEPGDTPQLETLFLLTRQHTFHWERTHQFKLEDFKQSTAGETIFIAEDDGAIVGFISVWEQDAIPFVHHLLVSKDHQKKGIARRLIQQLFAYLPLPYRLKCVAKNQEALTFYRKTGWVEVGQGIGEDGDYFLLELPADGRKLV